MKSLTNSNIIKTGEEHSRNADNASKYERILPSIEIMKIEDTKHLPQLERPDAFIEQLAVILSYEDETTI